MAAMACETPCVEPRHLARPPEATRGDPVNASGAVIVMSSFAAIWWIAGTAAAGRGSLLLYAVGLATSAVLVVLGWRRAGQRTEASGVLRHRRRVVGIASGVEGVMILVAVNALAHIGRRDLIAPVVAIIVGLHFLPLARWLPAPIYYRTGALLVIVGLASTAIQEPSERTLTVCVGAAAVLWLSSAVVLWRHAARA